MCPGWPSISSPIHRDAGAERSLEIAGERGWTIVSMRDDWKTVYDVEQSRLRAGG
jgi:hypothetical protein